MKTCLVVLTVAVAFLAGACSSDASVEDLAAVAESNATQPGDNDEQPSAVEVVANRDQLCERLAELIELSARPTTSIEENRAAELARLAQVIQLHDDILEVLPADAAEDVGRYFQVSRALTIGLEDAARTGQGFDIIGHTIYASYAARDLNLDAVLDDLETRCPAIEGLNLWITGFESPLPTEPLTNDQITEFDVAVAAWLSDPATALLESGLEGVDGEVTASLDEPLSTLESGITDAGSMSGDGSSVSNRTLVTDRQSTTFESVEITIRGIDGIRDHRGGTGRDTDDIYLQVGVEFDRSHSFEPENFVMVSPDGTMHPAEDDGELALDRASISFPVPTEVEDISGWQFRVQRGDDSAVIEY